MSVAELDKMDSKNVYGTYQIGANRSCLADVQKMHKMEKVNKSIQSRINIHGSGRI